MLNVACASCNPLAMFQAVLWPRSMCQKRLIQAFVSQLSIETLDEAILLGLAWRDIVPIYTRILNPFEDRHADELGAVTPSECR